MKNLVKAAGLAGKMPLHGLEPLPDVGVETGVDERDAPILDVAVDQDAMSAAVISSLRMRNVVAQRCVTRTVGSVCLVKSGGPGQ